MFLFLTTQNILPNQVPALFSSNTDNESLWEYTVPLSLSLIACYLYILTSCGVYWYVWIFFLRSSYLGGKKCFFAQNRMMVRFKCYKFDRNGSVLL